MINYSPLPILFSIKGIAVYSHSAMMFLAMICVYLIGLREVKQSELDADFYTKIAVWTLIGAFLGARLHSVIGNYQYYLEHLNEIIFLHKGGTSLGGLFGGFLAAFVYAKLSRKNMWKYADAAAPAVPFGIFLVRIGCFLNWDDIGIACNLPWCVAVNNDVPRHPAQLYESLFGLGLTIILFRLKQRKQFDGHLFLVFAFLYCTGRFFIEFLRDSKRYMFDLTFAQITAAGILILISGYFLMRMRIKKSFSA